MRSRPPRRRGGPIPAPIEDMKRVENALPGLRCNSLEIKGHPSDDSFYVNLSVSGSAENLIRHDLITQKMIDLLPRGGYKRFGERAVNLFRTSRGYRLVRWCSDAEARDLLQSLGVDIGSSARPLDRGPRVSPQFGRVSVHAWRQRDCRVGRWQRQVRWFAIENVIWPDWREVRSGFARGMLPARGGA